MTAKAQGAGGKRRTAARIGGAALLIAAVVIWEGVSAGGLVDEQVLPRFSVVVAAWWELLTTGELLRQVASSLGRQVAGFMSAVVIGVTLGVAMARYRAVDDLAGPLITLIMPIPKAALIPLVMLWFGIGDIAKTIVVFLGTILPVVVSAYHAAGSVEQVYLWSARSMGDSEAQLLRRVILRAALPEIMSGIRMGLIISLIVLVGAEMLAGRGGIGWLVFYTLDTGAYRVTYAAMLTIAIIGFAYDRLFLALSRRLLHWAEQDA